MDRARRAVCAYAIAVRNMSAEKKWRLVCYDIRDPQRYRRVHTLLKGTGHAVQYSIFRARLDERELERLRWELSRLLDPEDSLMIVDLCPSCARSVISRSQAEDWVDPPRTFAIVPDNEEQQACPDVVAPSRAGVRGAPESIDE